VYTFGKGEGGQLGHPQSALQYDKERNSYFVDIPSRVRGLIDNLEIVQVACGESHTLVLSSKNEVYSWDRNRR
jgi:alpha-tubulin suppressor-like RCC1 family protein